MKQKQSGFTIVELLIVIVVIAILAAIVIVAYNGVQNRARESALKSDLSNAAKQMEAQNAENGSYPGALPSSVKASNGNVLSLSESSSGFCINGSNTQNDSLRFRYESGAGLQAGLCNGAVISGSESGQNPNLITNTNFSSGWWLNMPSTAMSGRTLSTRAGSSGDPYENRPVLTIANSASSSTAWAVLQADGVNRSAIQGGKTYTASYYVRKIGSYNGTTAAFGVLDSNGQNRNYDHGGWSSVQTSWQRVSQTRAASGNATGGNILYLPLDTAQFTTSGWQLEFQGFELREQ